MLETFAESWLALQCQMIAGAHGGVLVLGAAANEPSRPIAQWPRACPSLAELMTMVKPALAERRGVIRGPRHGGDTSSPRQQVAYPILVDGQPLGVVVIDMESRPEPQQRTVLQLLHWSTAWLALLVRQEALATNDRLVMALNLIATSLDHGPFRAAATAAATELATRLNCERVSIGFVKGTGVQLQALSHSARFSRKTTLIKALEAAMTEALDQDTCVAYPYPESVLVTYAHSRLAELGAGACCTVPFAHQGRLLGAITLECDSEHSFDAATLELMETVAALLGPILATKQREERGLITQTGCALGNLLSKLFGPRHVGFKLSAAMAGSILASLVLLHGDYRVSARATLEGAVQRAVVAPLDGYVAAAGARAGDVVQPGAMLFKLDDRDLQLERLKWASQREQFLRQYRDALAQRERAAMRIVKARLDQAEAQLALVEAQLARIEAKAPFAGVVVSGDLSQSLGAPVQRGDVLFQIAPLQHYRLVLEVDERDIDVIATGQQGKLALASGAGEALLFEVEKITPVAAVVEGRNTFRVEARLLKTLDLLRPGMEGIGKIYIERRKLIWIWTHSLLDWLRLRLWAWWP